MIETGGGAFDPKDRNLFFIASNVERMIYGSEAHPCILTAVNELETPLERRSFVSWLETGKTVFLDSGVYALASEHARAHGVSHDEALNLAPDQIDGFDALLRAYLDLVDRHADQLWGYIEIDQGGRENKKRTRAMLEAKGLRPIPVYHPFADGWDYFDELARGYDRICLGNIVQAAPAARLRLLATIHQRKQAYPHLWVHGLGLTPNEVLNAYPLDSADSSSWLAAVRWSGYQERSGGANLGPLPPDYQYVIGADRDGSHGHRKATRIAAWGTSMVMANWREHLAELDRYGCSW